MELRRDILESSKEIIHVLQTYHELQDVRVKKKKLMENLSSDIKEINLLLNKLKAKFPMQKFKIESKRKLSAPVKKEKTAKQTKLDKLESSLEEIDRKLSSLD